MFPPGRLYLTAFDNRFKKTCSKRWRSARTAMAPRASTDTRTTTSARSAIGLVKATASCTRSRHGHGHHGELEVSTLDPGDVEHLVDQVEEVAARPQDVVDAVGLEDREIVQLQQLREAQDRVQWGAQLVAHAGEEVALGLAGFLGRLAGSLQSLLEFECSGDVTRYHHRAGEVALLVEHRLATRVDGDPSAIGMMDAVAKMDPVHPAAHHADECGADLLEVVGMDLGEDVRRGRILVLPPQDGPLRLRYLVDASVAVHQA